MANTHDIRFQNLEEKYDIIIVGGGIHGASLAWEASSRGLSTLLLEKNDFCSGTSANSLKVVHGGIRYLQSLDFRRMRESIAERRALLRIAPHLVKPMKCVMPTYQGLTKNRWVMALALFLYRLIAWDQNRGLSSDRRLGSGGIFSLSRLKKLYPTFSASSVTGGAFWFDAQVHNMERLVISFIMSANKAGAKCINYAEVVGYLVENKAINSIMVRDKLTGNRHQLKARAVVDCRGPWAARDQMLAQSGYKLKTAKLARAVNLVIKRKMGDSAFGVKPAAESVPEGASRLLFITPWREGSMIGTWYFLDSGSPDDLSLSDAELQDCLRQVNSVFPWLGLTADDVTNIHLGMLPVDSVNAKTGEPELAGQFSVESAPGATGLFVVQGVKFTTARHLAEYTIDQISKRTPLSAGSSSTSTLPLYGAEGLDDIDSYRVQQHAVYSSKIPAAVINRLIDQYGRNFEKIMEYLSEDASAAELLPAVDNTIKAEILYVIENEKVFKLADLCMRRTDIGTFSQPSVQTLSYCADIMASRLGWDNAEKQQQIQQTKDEFRVLNELSPR